MALLVPVLLVSVVAGSASANGSKVYAPKDCTKPRIRPSRIVISCADFGLFVTINHWNRWGRPKAKGKGDLHANTCRPDCATGKFKEYPVKVRLRKIREKTCGGRRLPLFRRMILRFLGPEPKFASAINQTQLFCD
jgi:hypothetical protein